MIHESYYWKLELLKSFQTIGEFRFLKRKTEISFVKVEKAIMFSAYVIRKLCDAEKIPINFLDEQVDIEMFDVKSKIVDHFNWHKIDSNYALDKNKSIKVDWKYLLNQIIHSFTFSLCFDENERLDGFFLNSDKSKCKSLYFINIEYFMSLLLKISEGDITERRAIRKITKNSNGLPELGEMRQVNAVYEYPIGFDLKIKISETLSGNIYQRLQR